MTRREGKVGIVTEKRLMPLGQISQQSDADWWLIYREGSLSGRDLAESRLSQRYGHSAEN
jgi:hypothetical protein